MPISMVQPMGQMPAQAMRAASETQAGDMGRAIANASAKAEPSASANQSYHALELLPPGQAQSGPLAQMATDMLGQVHGQVDTLSRALPEHMRGSAKDEVALAKEGLSPKQDSINPSATAKGNGKDDALDALSKTFDHAIFMAMVNQVISGVGDTQRTLIRQS